MRSNHITPTGGHWRHVVAACALALLAACGGGGSSSAPDGAPVITLEPSAASGTVSGSVTFSVQANGRSLTYQWQFSSDAGTTWADIAGATEAQYVLASVRLAQSGWLYRVQIGGGGTVVTSDAVALTVSCGLVPRLGGKAFYDACLNVTWLADANLPATLPLGVAGVQADGTMTWPTAKAWIQALNASAYLGHADWRLPLVRPQDGSAFQLVGTDLENRTGQTDLGHNISAPGSRYAGSTASEMPFLFYNELGGVAEYALDGTVRTTFGSSGAPFLHVSQANAYWTGTEYGSTGAFAFDFARGTQYAFAADAGGWRFSVLALRDGDVAGGGGLPGVANTCQPVFALATGTVLDSEMNTGSLRASTKVTVVGPTQFEGHDAVETRIETSSLGFDLTAHGFAAWDATSKLLTLYGVTSRAASADGLTVQDVKAVATPPTVDRRHALAAGESFTLATTDLQTETLTVNGVPQAPTTKTDTTTSTVRLEGIETIVVPAGTFRSCKYVVTDTSGTKTEWIMAGYGFTVRSQSASGTSVLAAARVNGVALTAFP